MEKPNPAWKMCLVKIMANYGRFFLVVFFSAWFFWLFSMRSRSYQNQPSELTLSFRHSQTFSNAFFSFFLDRLKNWPRLFLAGTAIHLWTVQALWIYHQQQAQQLELMSKQRNDGRYQRRRLSCYGLRNNVTSMSG